MDIQVIGGDLHLSNPSQVITLSSLSSPRSLDEFELNIIDISSQSIWKCKESTFISINSIADFSSIRQLVESRKTSTVICVLPQNCMVSYNYYPGRNQYEKSVKLKDKLTILYEKIIPSIIPLSSNIRLQYEITTTTIGERQYSGDFTFPKISSAQVITTKSDKSNCPTTIYLGKNIYASTLDITESEEMLLNFIHKVILKEEKEEAPQWVVDYNFFDDEMQNQIINKSTETIKQENEKIQLAECRLKENLKYKSILYTNGDELVTVIFDMLQKMFKIDLSTFEDEKKEDFLAKLDGITFIGEIKGITSNVKNEHISQLDVHYQSYIDELEEKSETETENVKQLLIINPFRNQPLSERKPIHDNQVKLANRNGCLIIETKTLLELFQKFLNEEININQCIELFSKNTGVLSIP